MATPTVADVLTQARLYLRSSPPPTTGENPTIEAVVIQARNLLRAVAPLASGETYSLAGVIAQAKMYISNLSNTTFETPTLASVLTGIRAVLADEGQEEFTDAILQPHFESAYRELYSNAQQYGLATSWAAVPPTTGSVGIPASWRFLVHRAAAEALFSKEGGVENVASKLDARATEALDDWTKELAPNDSVVTQAFNDAWRELYNKLLHAGVTPTWSFTPPSSGNITALGSGKYLATRTASLILASLSQKTEQPGLTIMAAESSNALEDLIRIYGFPDQLLIAYTQDAYRELYGKLLSMGVPPSFSATPPSTGVTGVFGGMRYLASAACYKALAAGSDSEDPKVLQLQAKALGTQSQAVQDALQELIDNYQYPDSILTPFFQYAYREIYSKMQLYSIPLAERKVNKTITAGTLTLDPVAQGILDMGSPILLEERNPGDVTDRWTQMVPVEAILSEMPDSTLGIYLWYSGVFWFRGATQDREIQVEYIASGNPPVSGTVGVDDSLNFLAARTAAMVLGTKGATLNSVANEALDEWISIKVRQMNTQVFRRPAFRTW